MQRSGNGGSAERRQTDEQATYTGRSPTSHRAFERSLLEQTVSSAFGICVAAIALPSRGSADAAFARQVAMYLAHISLGLNLTAVGRMFGRDRTTVAHACALVEDRRDDRSLDTALVFLEYAVRLSVERMHGAGGLAPPLLVRVA